MNKSKLKFWIISFSILLLLFSYLVLSSPDEVVIKKNSDVSGLLNTIRARLQGKSFWQNQLKQVDQELEWLKSQPERTERINIEIDKILRENEESMEKLYKKYPKIHPSPSKSTTESLREMANEVERAEFESLMENYRLERIYELEMLRRIIRRKLQ